MTDKIKIRVDGLVEGRDPAAAARQLAALLKREPEQIARMLRPGAPPLRIRVADKAAARRLADSLEACGCRCAVEEPEAIDILQSLAEEGDVKSQAKLAQWYAAREGGDGDAKLAAEWASRAARGNDRDAQFLLAEMYRSGRGVEADKELSLAWLRRAARQGHKEAQAALAKLHPQLSAGDARPAGSAPSGFAASSESRTVMGGGTYRAPPMASNYSFLTNVMLRVLVIGGLLSGLAWAFYSTERQMPSFLAENIDLIRAEVAKELATAEPACVRTRSFPLNDRLSWPCKECVAQAEAGLLTSIPVQARTRSGREITRIRYELTRFGRSVYVADRPDTKRLNDAAFCFGRSRLEALDWIQPMKSPSAGEGWLLGLKYTAVVENPHEFLYRPEAADLELPVFEVDKPTVAGPFYTTVMIGLDRKFHGLRPDIVYGRFAIEQMREERLQEEASAGNRPGPTR